MRSRNKRSKSDSNSSEQARQAPQQGAEKHPSVIGASLHFVGEIRSTGSVRVEGQVKGKVAARNLTVGQSGGIDGDVAAEMAEINGLITGDLAADTVVLGSGAQVVGDITYGSLAMEPGARFEGRTIQAPAAPASGEAPSEGTSPPGAVAE